LKFSRRDFLSPLVPATLSAVAIGLGETGPISLVGAAYGQAASEQPATPPPPKLMDPGPLPDRVLGSDSAPVTIVEYASMTCSHCAEFAITTFVDLKKEFIDTGKVRYIAREFPLDDFAAAAAMLVRSVSPDRYYPAMELLFRRLGEWYVSDIQPLMTLATTELGFTEESFRAVLADQDLLKAIAQMRDRGEALGVTGTPSLFLNGEKRFSGYVTIKSLRSAIEPLLKT
jgi:protein-disulfide isomerase